MKYYISTAFLDTSEVVEIAKAADDLGYDGMGIPDHVINLETLKTPYPYTKDGTRRWEAFTDWPDPSTPAMFGGAPFGLPGVFPAWAQPKFTSSLGVRRCVKARSR